MVYEQSTGKLFYNDGRLIAQCYSGFNEGKNNPELQDKANLGPIPQGSYTLGSPEHAGPGETSKNGPYTIRLTQDPANKMFGRDGFLMHGDAIKTPGSASHGCIIPLQGKIPGKKPGTTMVTSGRALRQFISAEADKENRGLQVVRGSVPVVPSTSSGSGSSVT